MPYDINQEPPIYLVETRLFCCGIFVEKICEISVILMWNLR